MDEHGPYIAVAFTLPAGSFATILLREVMKNEVPTPPALRETSAEDDANEFEDESAGDDATAESAEAD